MPSKVALVKEVQVEKAYSPSEVSVAGTPTEVRPDSAKAESAMVVSPVGSEIVESALHWAKAEAPMVVVVDPRDTDESCVQPSKEDAPNVVASGVLTVISLVQPWKADTETISRPVPREARVSDVQVANADSPKVATVSGSSTEVMPLSVKAALPIEERFERELHPNDKSALQRSNALGPMEVTFEVPSKVTDVSSGQSVNPLSATPMTGSACPK